jgi:two-component system, sensor histidine kinase PdtaS
VLRTTKNWPLPIRLATTGAAVATTYLFQLPIERHVPGEPFLLFLLVVIASTLAFGALAGFVGVSLSTLLSIPFFEPIGSLTLWHATDLIKIELYAVLTSCSVIAFARLGNIFIAARQDADSLKRLNESKSILLRELTHAVANNFAGVAALIYVRSNAIGDARARAVLDEAAEQIRILGQVHSRLRAGDRDVSLDSRAFLENLCDALKASLARGRQISIQCEADDLPLSTHQAISIGLVVNELVTNAIKHAFPDDRRGSIRVFFEARKDNQLQLRVQDDGVGFANHPHSKRGLGQELVKGLSCELDGDLGIHTSQEGSSFCLRIPYINPFQQAE